MHKMRVKSDRYNKVKRELEEMGMSTDHLYPVDLYDKCVPTSKNDPDNLAKISQDNKDAYGLDVMGLEEE